MSSTGSGTGTPATPPTAQTAAALIAAARVALADTGESPAWSDDHLLSFLAEAVREYSQHLPRIDETRIAAVAGERLYALPWDTLHVLSVEYPQGREPAVYPRRIPYKHYRFAAAADAYDFLPRLDLTSAPALLLSFDPEPEQVILVRHTRPHAPPAALDDLLTVPADHHHVLAQYVLFAAARQLQAAEQANPTNGSSLLMGQLAANARRMEQSYLNALNRILFHRQGESAVASWG